MFLLPVSSNLNLHSPSHFPIHNATIDHFPRHPRRSKLTFLSPLDHLKVGVRSLTCVANKENSDTNSDSSHSPKRKSKLETSSQNPKIEAAENGVKKSERIFPTIKPKKPRRGRRSEAAACEDFVRASLERALASIGEQNSETEDYKEKILKERVDEGSDSDSSHDDSDGESGEKKENKKMVVEEDSSDWPLDADVGWGIRASEYFDQHPIKNVIGEDGVEIDWEGELEDNWVKEINCLEWESFAFHPSPLVVLVFERYNRATDNWKALKELEKAIKVYWSAKDRLPPRAVKIDINIERDLAYALKVRDCPQILFLRGNKIVYREKDFRTADELVHMIAHFYYKAKRPSCISEEPIVPPF